jgi:hypothetical protein
VKNTSMVGFLDPLTPRCGMCSLYMMRRLGQLHSELFILFTISTKVLLGRVLL